MKLPIAPLDDTALVDDGLEILTEEQCLAFLGSAAVGRVGITIGALPAILPVNYCLVGRSIYFRTAEGAKLAAAAAGNVVAFEVDDFEPFEHSGWSVLAIGRSEICPADDPPTSSLPLAPWARGERTHLVRVSIEMATGRRIRQEMPG